MNKQNKTTKPSKLSLPEQMSRGAGSATRGLQPSGPGKGTCVCPERPLCALTWKSLSSSRKHRLICVEASFPNLFYHSIISECAVRTWDSFL